MQRTIKLTEIVNPRSMVDSTTYRATGIPLGRIDHAEESEGQIVVNSQFQKVAATKIVKVNGDVMFVTESLDEVIGMMNADEEPKDTLAEAIEEAAQASADGNPDKRVAIVRRINARATEIHTQRAGGLGDTRD